MSWEALVDALAERCPTESYSSVDSTNTQAMRLAAAGAPSGTVVVADQQQQGRGRAGREWYSPPGCHLYLSVIWRPPWTVMKAPQVTLEVAVIIARWLEKEAGIRPQVKWPNDVLVGGRKCCGILTELRAEADRVDALVVGIGINILPFPDDTPAEIRAVATSVAEESSLEVSRLSLATTLVDSLTAGYLAMVERGGFDRRAWLEYSCTVGSDVMVHPPGGLSFQARAVDVSDTGVLIVERQDGRREEIIAGDVIPRGEN